MDSAPLHPEEDIGFTNDIDQCIRLARKRIAAGYMVKAHEAYLKELLEVKAQEPNYADGEPPGLSKDVYKRIWSLKQPVEPKDCVPKSSEINVKAILEAYRTRKLEVRPGMVSYWVDGIQISGLVVYDLEKSGQLAEEHISQGRAFWVEEPVIGTQLAALTIPPSNLVHQHNV